MIILLFQLVFVYGVMPRFVSVKIYKAAYVWWVLSRIFRDFFVTGKPSILKLVEKNTANGEAQLKSIHSNIKRHKKLKWTLWYAFKRL